MQNTVTRLKPRSADYGVAVAAFHDGDFSYCAEALASNETILGSCLRARALLRMERCQEALSVLERFSADSLPHAYAAELLVVRASVLTQLGDPGAEATLTEARARGFSSGFRAIECEVELVAAVAAWMAGRVDDAMCASSRVLDHAEEAPTFLGPLRDDYIFTPGFWRSRALDLRGLLDARREDYRAQATSLANAFAELDGGGVSDAYIESRMLANMAVLVRDIDSDVMASYVESRAGRLKWNKHTAEQEFQVFQAIGWNRAKRGDHLGAFRHLRRSANVAPTTSGQIKAILDRSFLARELGEVLTAQDELDHAVRLAKQVDWENSARMERNALYILARQLAPNDPKNARYFWDRYATLKSGVSLLMVAAHGDRRQRADECSAHGSVLLAEGNVARATSLFLESFEIYSEVGYIWRAASLAVELAELTGEARYYDFAASEAAKQPNSWLARRVAALKVPVTA